MSRPVDAVDVHFAVSGGAADGLGHVLRCAAIAREARDAGWTVAFSLHGDAHARARLEHELPHGAIETWSPSARAGRSGTRVIRSWTGLPAPVDRWSSTGSTAWTPPI